MNSKTKCVSQLQLIYKLHKKFQEKETFSLLCIITCIIKAQIMYFKIKKFKNINNKTYCMKKG